MQIPISTAIIRAHPRLSDGAELKAKRWRSAALAGAARDALAGRPEADEIDRWRRQRAVR